MNNAEVFTDGEVYERLMGRWTRLAGAIFLTWLDAPPHQRWLDVGCGNGAFTEQLIDQCAPESVFAIDPSEEQIAYARQRPGTKLATFEIGDAQQITLGDNSFDAAVMALVLAFLPAPDKAVAHMARVVRPGGWVAAYMWDLLRGGSPVTPVYTAMEALGMEMPVRPNPAASQLEVMRELWRAAGLDAIETRVVPVEVTFRDFDDFWVSNTMPVGPQGKAIARMPEQERQRLREHLRATTTPAADGRIVYKAVANAVKGRVRQHK